MSLNRLFLAIVLFFATLFVYFNAIDHPFVHDDVVFIQQNVNIARLDLKEIFLSKATPIHDSVNTYYRPLLEVIYRWQYQAFGLTPASFHLTNIIWHGVNAILVFVVAIGLGLSTMFAWGVALFFALHPVQSEAVACIAGVSNIAVTFFVLLAWYAYLKNRIVLTAIFFLIALCAKESALVFIPLVIATDWLKARRVFGKWLALLAVALLFFTFRQSVTQSSIVQSIFANPHELMLRLLHIPTALMTYIRSVIWPGDLHYYRNLDILSPWWPAWIVMMILSALAFFLSPSDVKERRLYWFGFAVFIIGLLPVLNIIPLVNEYSLILTADHFLYFPVIGLLISIGCLLRQWLLPFRRRLFVSITILLASMLTVYQNTFWQSEVALFERTVQFEPNFGRGHALLAKAYYFNKRYAKAIEHYAKAQGIFESYLVRVEDPVARRFYLGFLKGIHFDQAQAYLALGKYKQAEIGYIQAINLDSSDSIIYNNLATVLMVQGKWVEAQRVLQQAIKLSPTNLMARNNLGVCLINTGFKDLAQTIWIQTLKINPAFKPAQENLDKSKGL